MNGEQIKKILRVNGYSLAEVGRLIGKNSQSMNSLLSRGDIKTSELEKIAAAIGKDVPFFYGVDSSACSAVAGENATAVAGNNNRVNSESLVNLLTKKDEQIDRLLNIIESLSK